MDVHSSSMTELQIRSPCESCVVLSSSELEIEHSGNTPVFMLPSPQRYDNDADGRSKTRVQCFVLILSLSKLK